jgi:hypothetical protein
MDTIKTHDGSADEAVRWAYFQRENAWRDEQARLDYATEKGLQQGEQRILELWKQGISYEEAVRIIQKQ